MNTQPDFVSFDSRERDELLSQIGTFSPNERSLFHRICDRWSPRISVDALLRNPEATPEQELSALERLMARLRGAEIGVLTTRHTDQGRAPHEIILTTKGSLEFWLAVVEEAIDRLLHQGFQLLPSEDRLRDARALPPGYHLVDGDSATLIEAYHGNADPETIFRMRLLSTYRILFTNATAKPIILRATAALRRDLVERGMVDEIARISESTIIDVRKRLDSKAPDVWLDLTRLIVKERGTIAFRRNCDENDEIFQLAYLVMTFVDAQIGFAREQQEHDEVVAAEIRRIGEAVSEAPNGSLTEDQFAALVDEVQAKLGNAASIFSHRLGEQLLTPKPKRTLPSILHVNDRYIAAPFVRRTVDRARSEMRLKLTEEYTDLMEAFLRGRSPELGEIWSSRDLFHDDVSRRVRRQHALLASLLERPQVIAEAVILDTKQRREGITPEELRASLGDYFDVNASALRPIAELLGLDVVAIFDDAFARVGVLRQIFLRISGRHESLRASYVRRFGPRRPRLSLAGERVPPDGVRGGSSAQSDDVGLRARGTGNRGYRAETMGRPRRVSAYPSRPKPKSKKEIDESWQEFNKALHTRPSEEDFS